MTVAKRLEEGLAHQQAGRLDEAETCYTDVLATAPENTEAMKLLAIVCASRGDYEDALNYASAAIELQPDVGDYYFLLGRLYLDVGQPDEAIAALSDALNKGAEDQVGVAVELAGAYGLSDAWEESLGAALTARDANANDPRVYQALATAAAALGRGDEALGYYKQGLRLDPKQPMMWSGAAKLYRSLNDLENAWFCIERALALSPEDLDMHYAARLIRTEAVPAWHFNMMNDEIRNKAFKTAIERQIKPHHRVLEIGTGAGLLSMMAARTGAHVTTCEANGVLATAARGHMEQNGLADRVTVVGKPSWEVEVGADLPEQADVLVAEIFSAQLLSEEVIPTLEDAKRRLLKPDAIVIPAAGAMVGALVSSDELAQLARVNNIEGFTFNTFNAFTPLLMNLELPDTAYDWLSDAVDLLTFDFQGRDNFPAEETVVAVEVKTSGTCQGVVQWLRLMLDDQTPYENAPKDPTAAGGKIARSRHWTPLFYPFPIPREVKAGQVVTLRVGHDRKGARVELVSID